MWHCISYIPNVFRVNKIKTKKHISQIYLAHEYFNRFYLNSWYTRYISTFKKKHCTIRSFYLASREPFPKLDLMIFFVSGGESRKGSFVLFLKMHPRSDIPFRGSEISDYCSGKAKEGSRDHHRESVPAATLFFYQAAVYPVMWHVSY